MGGAWEAVEEGMPHIQTGVTDPSGMEHAVYRSVYWSICRVQKYFPKQVFLTGVGFKLR